MIIHIHRRQEYTEHIDGIKLRKKVAVITNNRTINFYIMQRFFRWDLCAPVNVHFSPVQSLISDTFALLVVVASSLI